MEIQLFMTADKAQGKIDESFSAIVIDVLRATSVIATAIDNGADRIKAFLEIEETKDYKAQNSDLPVLLCGERKGLYIEGFDLSNSPREYTKQAVEGKIIAMTTTNGTKSITYAKPAKELYTMSFLNLRAVCNEIKPDCERLALICSGTNGYFSIDDFLCAGKAIEKLCQTYDCKLDNGAYLAKNFYEQNKNNIRGVIEESAAFKLLVNAGLAPDIDFCLQNDIFTCVPVYKDGFIVEKHNPQRRKNSRYMSTLPLMFL